MNNGFAVIRAPGASLARTEAPVAQCPAVLNSWKEIATYLGRGVRTAQRWHVDSLLPVHRVRVSVRSPVFAFRLELDNWLRQCRKRDRTDYPHLGQGDLKTCSQLRTATDSVGKMSLLVSQQQDQLARLTEQVSRLMESQQRRSQLATSDVSWRRA